MRAGALLCACLALGLLYGCSGKVHDGDDDSGAGTGNAAGTGGSGTGGSGGAGAAGSGTGGTLGDAGASMQAGADGGGSAPVCGDGIVSDDEDCDGPDVGAHSCEELGYGPGALRCKATCRFDVTGCAPGELCGNGVLDGAEECDDGADNSDTEPDACRVNCTLPSCGDSVVDDGEGCDDGLDNSDFRADACRSDCEPAHCGDGLIDSGEDCDSDKLGRATCAREGFTSGVLGCTARCRFDTSRCVTCGDGTADGKQEGDPGYEACDTNDFRGKDCTDFGFAGGRLTCSECSIDTAHCGDDPPACGNDTIEAGETCDGSDLDGRTCADYGFTGGRLACKSDCSDFDPRHCNTCGNGTIEAGELCDDGNTQDDFTCAADCHAECGLGYGQCNGDTSTYCGFDHSGKAVIQTEYCDPLEGLSCVDGLCQGACAVAALGSSYLGCDYYPTITNNALVTTSSNFAVAVANSGSRTANITITLGTTTTATGTADPGDVAVILLPWTTLKTATTALVEAGAYHLRTDQPVTVYQYNPLEYKTASVSSTATNDASLLLPTNTWTGNYVVVARNNWSSYPGLYAVTAKEDGTEVTLVPSATGGHVSATVAGLNADGTGSVTLDAGDVLQVTATSLGGSPDASDLTGTRVQANKPVQVIGGHECTDVPYDVVACDHLEESMLPFETLGSNYVVAPPLIAVDTDKAVMVRVVAAEDDTTITYDPPQTGAPTTLAKAGDYFEISETSASFEITADRRIMVAEYMLGQAFGGATGDPAMVLSVPVEQFRTHYLFHAPVNYEANYVNITAPTGATVTLDGTAVPAGSVVGGSGYSVTQVALDNSGNGNHVIDASDRVGISVYGYGQYTSYWYPGGLELTQF